MITTWARCVYCGYRGLMSVFYYRNMPLVDRCECPRCGKNMSVDETCRPTAEVAERWREMDYPEQEDVK